MNREGVITGVVINSGQPVIRIPKPSQEGSIINIQANKKPSTTIVLSKKANLGKYIDTGRAFVTAKMHLDPVVRATHDTGDLAIRMEKEFNLPEGFQDQAIGIYENAGSAIAWEGRDSTIFTDIDFPVHPVTGERINLPTQTAVLENRSSVSIPPQTLPHAYETTNTSSYSTSNVTNSFVGPLTNRQLEEAKNR